MTVSVRSIAARISRDSNPTNGLADIAITNQTWRHQAACLGVGWEFFYVPKNGSGREAKELCARCPVTAECLEYALAMNERWGIWAGLNGKELQKLRVARGRDGRRRRIDIPCEFCGALFTPYNSLSMYCSKRCKSAAARRAS